MDIAIEAKLDEDLAMHYAMDLFHRSLLDSGEPKKASELVKIIGKDEVNVKLARVVLASHPDRFTHVDRKWTLVSRFADPTHTLERNLIDDFETFGLPATLRAMVQEMSAIFHQSVDHLEPILTRVLSKSDQFVSLGSDRYGLRKWLLNVSSEDEEDVLFDNFLKRKDVMAFEEHDNMLEPGKIESVYAFLNRVAKPVNSLVLQFLLWKKAPHKFNARKLMMTMLDGNGATLLSGGWWIGSDVERHLVEFFPAISQREVDEKMEGVVQDDAQLLVIGDEDRGRLIKAVLDSETSSHANNLLETFFEVTAEDSTYAQDLETVINVLKQDERVLWVGSDRFFVKEAIPAYVFTVPESLHFPVNRYTDSEGNEVDLLLEDDGLDGGLQRDILSPLAQDVLDEELAYTPDTNPPATARCVLKYHHKEIGTFPLCQLPPGFFAHDVEIMQVDLILPNGQKTEIWVNNSTRLVYGLFDWYSTLPVDSGAVFYLERQEPDRFVLTYGEETEPAMFISRNRVNELLELGHQAEEEEMPTFDILRAIMEHYRKGIDFITLLTETNIVRRTTRRMVASLLSSHHCFFQRGGAWVFDQKKLSQGFDKSKRKYLKK